MEDRPHDILAIGLADAPCGVQGIHHLAGGLLLGAGSQVGDDRFGHDEVGELHPSTLGKAMTLPRLLGNKS